jgi:hypothetical protein
MLIFSADPLGPELALPPQAVRPINNIQSKAKAQCCRLENSLWRICDRFISRIFSFCGENKS